MLELEWIEIENVPTVMEHIDYAIDDCIINVRNFWNFQKVKSGSTCLIILAGRAKAYWCYGNKKGIGCT